MPSMSIRMRVLATGWLLLGVAGVWLAAPSLLEILDGTGAGAGSILSWLVLGLVCLANGYGLHRQRKWSTKLTLALTAIVLLACVFFFFASPWVHVGQGKLSAELIAIAAILAFSIANVIWLFRHRNQTR